jgi:hypothetical protein
MGVVRIAEIAMHSFSPQAGSVFAMPATNASIAALIGVPRFRGIPDPFTVRAEGMRLQSDP